MFHIYNFNQWPLFRFNVGKYDYEYKYFHYVGAELNIMVTTF